MMRYSGPRSVTRSIACLRKAGLMQCGRFIQVRASTLSGTTSETLGRGTPAFVIDHLLLSPSIVDRLVAADVDRQVRDWEKASDHAPAWVELGDARGIRFGGEDTNDGLSGRNGG